ncbi:MAG: NTP transferase domain-containing protein [Bacteroidaceae bacterium]|nr:NTP transferase domain-containing protein [Bacteroidaceae bacterium]
MKYAILAAGEGSRLQQEGIHKSKPLVEINGEPMIKRLVRIFMDNSAEEIVIITNNETADSQQYIRQLIKEGFPIKLIVKTTPSSMHSFYELHTLLGKGKFCMTTVDTIFNEAEFHEYINAFASYDGDALMGVTDYIDDEKPLYTVLDSDLNITSFNDTPIDGHNYVSGGIYGLTDKSFPILRECIQTGQSRMRNFQRQLVNKGLYVKAYPFTKILDVDHATDILKAEDFINSIPATQQ